jgi:hypothetical protein
MNLFVGYSQYVKTHFIHQSIPEFIFRFLLIMNFPVNLDDDRRGVTVKINDEAVDDLLAAKMEAILFVLAKFLPE